MASHTLYFHSSLDAKHLDCYEIFSSGVVRNQLLTLYRVCDPSSWTQTEHAQLTRLSRKEIVTSGTHENGPIFVSST